MTNVFFITVLQQFKRNAYDLFVQIIYLCWKNTNDILRICIYKNIFGNLEKNIL